MSDYQFSEIKYGPTKVMKMVNSKGDVRLFDKQWFLTMSGILDDDDLWESGVNPDDIKTEQIDKDHIKVRLPLSSRRYAVKRMT